ncbi:MAG: DUF5050 domain-containing protein [Defluviitaleaceae bacterium]|nr:DUF5050 domain-containing protein [Defluviitaleaceae bacterium]
MPLPIDVKPYELNSVTGGDNYMTHYKATGADGDEFVITEFYPTYMVKREDDGTLAVSERFSKEFIADREEFVRRAEGFQEIRDASLHPVVEIFERNQTAYMVRKACGMTSVDQFMGSQTMDYDEAYYFIRPIILSMAQAAEKGMMFNITFADFRVNAYRQLVLCAPPAWDSNFHPQLTETVKLYYRLVTGVEAPAQNAPAFSAYGIEVPPRIESLVLEILQGDILYGSLDDFYKKFKSLLDVNSDTDKESGKKTLAIMRGVVIVLFVAFAFSLVLFVFGAVRAREMSNFWANPELFVSAEVMPEPELDFSDVTITHPRNPADALTGSFSTHNGFMFFRGEDGLMARFYAEVAFIPGATLGALADNRLIIPGVTPSYIVGHGRYIYFVDTSSGGMIYASTTSGDDFRRVTEHAALNLAVIDGHLFYTNTEKNHHLYRINLETKQTELVAARPVYSVIAHGSYLFFVTGGADANELYIWDTEGDNPVILASRYAKGAMRVSSDVLFFLDINGRVRSIDFTGRPIAIHAPENVSTFDVYLQFIVFAEEGRHVPRMFNMNTGEFNTISSTEWVSYLWTFDNGVYAIDHRNPHRIIHAELP